MDSCSAAGGAGAGGDFKDLRRERMAAVWPWLGVGYDGGWWLEAAIIVINAIASEFGIGSIVTIISSSSSSSSSSICSPALSAI